MDKDNRSLTRFYLLLLAATVVIVSAAIINSTPTAKGRAAVAPLRWVENPIDLQTEQKHIRRIVEDGPDAIPPLVELLRHEHERVRSRAQWTLGKFGPSAVPAIVPLVTDKVALVRREAIEALACIDPPTAEVVPAILARLEDKTEAISVRRSAAWALGCIGLEAKAAIPTLRMTLRDADSLLRQRSATALGFIGPSAMSALPDLLAALKDQDKDVRASAGGAIVGGGSPPDTIPYKGERGLGAAAIPELKRLLATESDENMRQQIGVLIKRCETKPIHRRPGPY